MFKKNTRSSFEYNTGNNPGGHISSHSEYSMGNHRDLLLVLQHVARYLVSFEKTVDKMQVSRELECYVILRTNPLKHLVHDLATTHGVASLYQTKGLDRSV